MKIALVTLHVRPSPQAVPLAAGCLAASLPDPLRAGARLLDFYAGADQESMREEILAAAPDLVAFPLYVWNRLSVLALARKLRQERPDLLLVAGGPEASADPAGVLAAGDLDGVVRGEGELAFPSLIETLAANGAPAGLPGILWRTPAGLVEGPEPPPAEPETLPSPWLSGIFPLPTAGGVLWETSRGCTFGCDYCFDSRGSRGLRPFPRERLDAELELFARSGVAHVWILDSTFNYPPERGKELLRLLLARAPHIHFHLEAKAEFLDRETARLLSRLSCSVQVGLQSAHPKILRRLHRSLDPELFSQKIQLLNTEGVTFGLDLIWGLPGDDYAGFRASVDWALDFAPNQVDLFPLAVLPGTPLHERREELALRAQEHPPYEITGSASWSAGDLARSRRLAAAANLFYNIGRAVAFLPSLLRACGLAPSAFLEAFADWTLSVRAADEKRLCNSEGWRPAEVLALQEGFTEHLLRSRGKADLLPAALDLIRFHYHYAEALLGPETVAPANPLQGIDPWDALWRRAPQLRLVPFTYEVLDLQEMGEMNLEEFARLFRPVGSVALFLRQGEEVLCESLEENFLRLLQEADGRRSPREIFGGSISRQEGEEIVEFAVAEGLLLPG